MKDYVEKLINHELHNANDKFPPFSSAHEGYAVLREEIEELEEEVSNINTYFDDLWNTVRDDKSAASKTYAKQIKSTAIKAIQEAIQVAAMAQKFVDSLGSEEVVDND